MADVEYLGPESVEYLGPVDTKDSFLAPLSGTITSTFHDSRGERTHESGDIAAPSGTSVVAPGNMEFVDGRQGGKNLRDNDFWAHFKDLDNGVTYRFAHIGDISHLKPGDIYTKGSPFTTVGSAIDRPHLHMKVVGPDGTAIDWVKRSGLDKSKTIEKGGILAQISDWLGPSQAEAAETPKVEYLGPVGQTPTTPTVEYLGPAEVAGITPTTPTFPSEKATPQQALEERAKIEDVVGTGSETEPVYFNPPLMAGGLLGIGRGAAGSLLGSLGKTGLQAIAKALPGYIASETAGAATLEALDKNKSIPEWAKIPLSLVGSVAGGLATSKLGDIGAGARLRMAGGKAPMPPEEVILSELTSRINKGMTAQEALKEIADKYGHTVQDIISKPTTPGINIGAQTATKAAVKSPLDSSELGAPVVTRTFKTNVDSTLGPKGTVVDTIPLNEGHVQMREAFAQDGVDIKAPRLMGWKNTFKTNERIFSELDDIAPGFQDQFWGKLKQGENIAHKNTKSVFKEVDDLSSKFGSDVGDKIGIDLIAQRRSGLERLNKMGITPQPLTIEERQLANDFQIKFHDYLVRINEARALAGKQPIREDPNYITFMSNFVNKVTQGVNPIAANPNVFAIPSSTPFKFEKAMRGSKEAIETDLFKIFKNYSALAERHINISPHLEKIRKFLGPMTLPDGSKIAPLANDAPNAAVALANMAQTISGVKSPMNKLESLLSKASDNLVLSTLGAYPKSVINQTGSLAAGAAETGPINLIRGMASLLKPGAYKFTTENSNVLAQRKMDVVLEELGSSWVKSFSGKAKHYAMLPLEVVDDLMARGTWLGAVKKGLQMGLEKPDAYKFADKVVVRIQASASPIDRAMVQRSTVGKVFTAFQTFSIADANYIARNILGQGNINFKTTDGFIKLAKMTAVGLALNYIQRDVLGMPPALPEPIHAMTKARAEGAGRLQTAVEGVKEFAPFVPVLGSIAYGKVPGGALGGLGADVVGGSKSPAEALAMLAGVPGMNMMLKGLKTPTGREFLSNIESKTGLPVGPRSKLTYPPPSAYEIMFGRDQLPRKRKPWRID